MSSSADATQRFFRPADVARLHRNQRRIQVHHGLRIARNLVISTLVVGTAIWGYRHTQSDHRFAVRMIQISGGVHTARADLDSATRAYVGANLFRLDIERLQSDLRLLPWISRVDIEKKLPDTLRITIVERTPVALLAEGATIRYVDAEGLAFAPLSPSVGDADLPLIRDAAGPELVRCVEFVRSLRDTDPQVYSRVSEVRPLPPHGFAVFDRDLGTVVYADGADISVKWRRLYAIAAAEKFSRGSLEYADLRFADRVVIKPVHMMTTAEGALVRAVATQITN